MVTYLICDFYKLCDFATDVQRKVREPVILCD